MQREVPAYQLLGRYFGLVVWISGALSSHAQEVGATSGTSAGEPTARSSVDEVSRAGDWGETYQIRAFGQNPQARVMFSKYANDIRESFRSSVYRIRPNSPIVRGSWTVPIAIELWGDARDVYLGEDVRTEAELREDNRVVAKISVRMHDEFSEKPFRLEVIRALILDLMMAPYARDPSVLMGKDLTVPEWLVHGFDLYIEHREGGRPSAFFEGILKSGQMLKPAKLFAVADPELLDPVNYTIYRSSAGAMVAALLDQPDGDAALRSLLGDLPNSGPESIGPLLRQHFPAFREMDDGMEKWWALQVASFGQQQSFEFMNWEETERWLDRSLMVRWEPQEAAPEPTKAKGGFFDRFKKKGKPADPGGDPGYEGSLEQYAEFLGREGARERLNNCFMQVQALKRTGFPLYRPVMDRYGAVIESLINGKTQGVDEELVAIGELRNTIRHTLRQTSDYLNFFEATRAPERSKAFDDYSKMRRQLDEKPMPQRNDRITRHLDAVEQELR